MTINKSLKFTLKLPSLDREVLLAYTLKKDRAYLFSHPEKRLTKIQERKFKSFIKRRLKHEPVAYLTGHKEFYGLDFEVDKSVLIPRPETELLVDTSRQIANGKSQIVFIDVGTGSGCIAISLAKCLPQSKIYATDISSAALKIAQKNARRHQISRRIIFLPGNLLNPLLGLSLAIGDRPLAIIANLPYLTTKQWQGLPPDIKKYEPREALDGGKDGLKYYRQLIKQIKILTTYYSLPITVIIETNPGQIKKIKRVVNKYLPKSKIKYSNAIFTLTISF